MKRWNLAISGFGAIGRQTAKLLEQRHERYQRLYQADVRLVAVCGSQAGLYDGNGLAFAQIADRSRLSAGLSGPAFIQGAQPGVLIEAGPTQYKDGGPGYGYMTAALEHGTHVIAISKGALVFDYRGLRELAQRHHCMLKISGATSSALPTVDLLQYNLAGCTVSLVEGIVTATTNVVLSEMMQGRTLQEAVLDAQQRGMTEPDPTFDLEGWDTACKMLLIANSCFGAALTLDDIAREGIADVTQKQVERWKQRRQVPKLIGRIVNDGDRITATVRLDTFSEDHPFAGVSGKAKALRVSTDAMGDMLVVSESSPLATAAAALKDFEHILQQGQP